MTTLPENFGTLGLGTAFEIPRPKCLGMQFVSVRGRHGYYQTVNKSVAIKYGLAQQQRNATRRPALPDTWLEQQRAQSRATIVEEPAEAEPSPDYEQEEGADLQQPQQPHNAVPSAPPISAELRRSLLPRKPNLKKSPSPAPSTAAEEWNRKKSSFERLLNNMSTFKVDEEQQQQTLQSNTRKDTRISVKL